MKSKAKLTKKGDAKSCFFGYEVIEEHYVFKIALATAVVAAAMFAAKETNIVTRAGLVSSCSAVAGRGDEQSWQACPDLSLKSCTSRGLLAEVEYWACPARLSPEPKDRLARRNPSVGGERSTPGIRYRA